jgi:hypothetical protein
VSIPDRLILMAHPSISKNDCMPTSFWYPNKMMIRNDQKADKKLSQSAHPTAM